MDGPERGSEMNYVAAGYGITLVVLVAYTAWVLRRSRAIRAALPPDPMVSAAPAAAEEAQRP